MALTNIPENEKVVIDAAKADVQSELPGSGPFLDESVIGSLTASMGARVFDNYRVIEQAERQTWWDTSSDDQLDRWGGILKTTRTAATSATGGIVITGTVGIGVGSGIKYRSDDGRLYSSTNTGTVTANVDIVASITRTGSTATVTTEDNHDLANNVTVTIAGANEVDYNGAFAIKVTGLKTFTYTISNSAATPATGTITASHDSGLLNVASDVEGKIQNLSSGANLTLTSPISGIDDAANVSFSGIGGGTDLQSNSDYRIVVGDAFRGIPAQFNEDAIVNQARTVSGVTRVFPQRAMPIAGQVTVYFTRDNDDDIIPDASEVSAVKSALDEIRPFDMLDEDLIVSAPTPVNVDFSIGSVTPNTDGMKAAVTASLEQLFIDGVSVSEDLKQNAYTSAVFSTVDTDTGQQLQDFSVNGPAGDVTINDGELPVLGTVTFT